VKKRLIVVLVLAGLWNGALALRLLDLQVRRHDHYAGLAEQQQQRIVELASPRGTIYDARGRVLAVSVPVDSAWADPQEVEDPRATARAIARQVPVDVDELTRALSSDLRFVWVARKLDPPQADGLRELGLPGLHFLEEAKRYYPMRELAAGVLGFVGTDDRGLAGLELLYDEVVAGRPVERRLLRDARQATAAPPDLPFLEALPGKDLHLTLDAAIQHIVEEELARGVEERHARGGSAVVLDPRNGAVLAMASYPGFDPNRFTRVSKERWRNRPVQDAYEPGSTFKMVTAAAALANNVLDPMDALDCQMGGITVAGTLIRDHKPFGVLTFREVIARSSNVGAIKIGLAVGRRDLFDTIRVLGFGSPAGIDLPGESAGILHPVERWGPVTTANVAFGQGISVTVLQLTNAFAAVANGGFLYRPYVVAAVTGPGDLRRRARVEERGQPLAPAVAREIERLLEAVVSDGTGTAAAVSGYTVAGKTGTAQKANPEGRGYLANRYVASFTGFVPARDPVLVASVIIDEPRPPFYHGGQAAAPVFGRIAYRTLLYLGVPREPAADDPHPVPLMALGGAG
jgi:cell division protein FtsI (penicillin-binding protein 3)